MVDRVARDLQARLNGEFCIGIDRHTGAPVYVPIERFLETSVHVIGAAGYGKSYYLRHLIDQFIEFGFGFGVIEPHRELCEYALAALRRSGIDEQNIVIIDPGEERFATSFDPLRCGIDDPSDAVGMVLEAILKAWGAQSFDATPRLERFLRSTFRLLLSNGLSFADACEVLDVDNAPLRRMLRERVDDPVVRQEWETFEVLPRNEKIQVVESTVNRIRRVVQSRMMQLMLARTENTLDFRRMLDAGNYLIANIGGTPTPENQRLLGTLLVNGIVQAGLRRDPQSRKPYFLVIDEAGQFVGPDVVRAADELRKFGVGIVLSHQRLRQLERDDSEVLSSIMTNAKIKVVFGGLERVEAERMGRELFTGDVRGDRIKHRLMQTKFRPIEDTFEVETETESFTFGESDSESETEGWALTNAESSSEGITRRRLHEDEPEHDDDILSGGSQRSAGSSRSGTHSAGRSRQSSTSRGTSRSVVPITRHEEFQEESSRSYWSLGEQWEQRIALVHGLPKREALVRIYNEPVIHIVTPTVEPEFISEEHWRFRDLVFAKCPYASPVAELFQLVEDRRRQLTARIEESEVGRKPFDIKSFRS